MHSITTLFKFFSFFIEILRIRKNNFDFLFFAGKYLFIFLVIVYISVKLADS